MLAVCASISAAGMASGSPVSALVELPPMTKMKFDATSTAAAERAAGSGFVLAVQA